MSNNSQVATVEQVRKIQDAVGLPDFSPEQLVTLKNTIAKSISMQDFAVVLTLAKANDLNPFKKEIWSYKDSKGNLVTFAGRDGFLTIAQRNPNYGGIQSVAIYKNDKYIVDSFNPDPNKIVSHQVTSLSKAERGALLGAVCIAYLKNGLRPYVEIVMLEDYVRNSPTWKSHPEAMIKKVSETNALKKVAGATGLQSEYDFEIQNNVAVPIDNNKKDHASDATFTPIEDVTEDEAAKIKRERMDLANQMVAIFDKYPDDEEMQGYRQMCTDKMNSKEFNLEFARNTMKDVLAREQEIESEKAQGDEG